MTMTETVYQWNFSSPEQIFSMIGSVIILLAYALMVARPNLRLWYFSISIFGGLFLLAVAWIYHNAGFVFLEVAWISINAWGLWKMWRERAV